MGCQKKWYRNAFVIYTLSFIVVSLIAFSWFAINHKSFIWGVDGFRQHYPMLVKLRHMCGEFFRGNGFAFWSQDIGLGVDTIGNMAVVICDLFNYIAAAFPPKIISIGYSLAVFLRMYTAGWTMIAFLKYHGLSKRSYVIGGLGYAFSSWAVGVICHGFFLNPLILFPLLILGIDYVFDHKKPYLLIFSVGMSLITYLYFAYMSSIFCLLYVIVRFWLGEHDMARTFKEFMRLFGKLCSSIAVACMVTAPIIISAAYAILSVTKSEATDISVFLSLRESARYLPSLISNIEINENYSYTGMNALFLATIPFMVINRKKKNLRIPVIFFFFCFIMTAIPMWGSIMNGLNYSVGRWCYILAFFFTWAAVATLEEMEKTKQLNHKVFIIWVGVLFVWLIAGKLFVDAFSYSAAAIGMINLFTMVLMLWLLIKHKKQYLYILLLLNIAVVHNLSFLTYPDVGTGRYMGFLTQHEAYEKSVLRAADVLDDSDYYRVDYIEHINSDRTYLKGAHASANENMYWGQRTASVFLSTIDGTWLKLNKELVNSPGYYDRTTVFSNDNRSRLNFLEGIKYFLSNQDTDNGKYAGYGYATYKLEEGVEIQRLNHDAGLGYVYPKVIGEEQYADFAALDKEQIMMQAAVLSDEDIRKLGLESEVIDPQEISLDTAEVEYVVDSESPIQPEGNGFEVLESNQKLDIIIPQCENCELYVEFQGIKKTPDPYGNFEYFVNYDGVKKIVRYIEGDQQAITDQTVFMANLGYYPQTSGKISLEFKNVGKYSYDSLKVYAVSQENFDKQAEDLTAQRFTMIKQTANSIEGTVNAQQDGILYLNLLYHPGWKMYVDGEEQKIIPVNTAFCGAKISQGEHEIVLTYRPVAYRISLLLCCMGMLCIAGMVVVYKRRESKDKQKGSSKSERA